MTLRFGTSAALLAVALFSGYRLDPRAAGDAKPGIDWPQFRGIRATGVADGFPLLASWDVAKSQGVAWKTPIPGLGLSESYRVCRRAHSERGWSPWDDPASTRRSCVSAQSG